MATRVIALLFLAKAVALALFVTPLWDVPDETGHYAIIQDLADGRGLPLPGRSVIAPNILSNWMKGPRSSEPFLNWVAQHPPLYHLIAVPFLKLARALTENQAWQFRAPRLLSAMAGAAALLVFFRVFQEASDDPFAAFIAAAGIGFIPMYSHLSSGTNHDIFVALLAGTVALYWTRLIQRGRFSDGLKMAVALALMGAVKLSAIPVAGVLTLLCWRVLPGRGWRRAIQWLALAATAVSLPTLWTLRHWWLVGNARVHPTSGKPFALSSFLTYLRGDPVVDHSFKNFFGLMGWTGTGGGSVRWFQISGFFLAPFLLLGLAATTGAAWWFWTRLSSRNRALAGSAAVLVFLFCFGWLFSGPDGGALVKRLLYSLVAAVPLLALPEAFGESPPERRLLAGSQVVFLVFATAYLVNSWEAYEIYGAMRATNGRYFFAVLPFLVMAFVLPPTRLWRSSPRRNLCLLLVLAALFANETAFYLLRVIPFYRSGC